LHYCASDSEERKQIEAEHEAWRVYHALLKNELTKVNEQTKTLAEKDAIIAEKDAALVREQEENKRIVAEKEAALIREQEENKRIIAEKEALIAELNALKNRKNT
jgi:vacuolar-type H+-ATPase subunit B/Vma2